MLVMMFALLLLLALLLILVPMLITQFENLTNRLPQLIDFAQNKALPWLHAHFGGSLPLNKEAAANWLKTTAARCSRPPRKSPPPSWRRAARWPWA